MEEYTISYLLGAFEIVSFMVLLGVIERCNFFNEFGKLGWGSAQHTDFSGRVCAAPLGGSVMNPWKGCSMWLIKIVPVPPWYLSVIFVPPCPLLEQCVSDENWSLRLCGSICGLEVMWIRVCGGWRLCRLEVVISIAVWWQSKLPTLPGSLFLGIWDM